ncbi:alpha/beta hydrolase [Sphingomonas sinipercae]|uniref:Alpha/beta hydrolase n=1 Tax=Sphingomonas sinipercae TaxID=2714944 RepID=A0A6G7ZPC5_9SPHN|nr:alpha/beta hydrolase [Sphingomonas sinipercae]QIL02847.1 alpha/beta hydrolase [Sphingomonas sinipercae]
MPRAVTSDKVSLFYKDWGPREGKPIVLLHGWPLTADTFDDLAVALAEDGYRSIVPDRRGFGRSDQPWDGYDYDTFASDTDAVLQDAGIGGPFAVAGFSMGGGEVARLVARHKERITQAILISSVVPYMLQTSDNPNGVPQSTFDEMTAGMKKDRADFFTAFARDFFGVGAISHPVSDAVLHDFFRQAMMAGLKPTLAAAKAFATTDFRGDLSSFTMPTLVIHGTKDVTVPIDVTAREVKKAVPHAQLIEYDGSAHGLFATDKQRLTDDIRAFLGSAAETRSAIPMNQSA